MAIESDVLVIGRGIAGMAAGTAAARAGADVRVVAGTESTLRQASGLIDVLGYPGNGSGPLVDPFSGFDALSDEHPYRTIGEGSVRAGLALFDDVVGDAYLGDHTNRNALVPTHGGTVKPTARYPQACAAGLASDPRDALLVGFETVPDLDAPLVAEHLGAAGVPFDVRGVTVPFPGEFRQDAKRTRYAQALDADELLSVDGYSLPAREALAERVKEHLGNESRVGFPALLGLDRPDEVRADLAELLGVEIFEVAMGPPSIPGMRLGVYLERGLREAGATLSTGNLVVDYDAERDRIDRVFVDRNGARIPYRAEEYVLATGGLVGKGVGADRERVSEPVFNCHVPHPENRYDWFVDEAFGEHPFARFGVRTDDQLRPLDADGRPEFGNLRAAGSVLGGYDFAAEKSGGGVSLATGRLAGELAAKEVA